MMRIGFRHCDLHHLSWWCYGLGFGTVVALSCAAFFLVVAPIEVQRRHIERETRALQGMNDLLPAVVAEAESLQRNIRENRHRLDEIRHRLPSGAKEAEFLSQLTQLSKQHDLEMADYRPSPTTVNNGLSELSVTIALDGSYEGICRFLERIDTIPRLIRTSGFQLRPSASGRCVAELQLCAYYRDANQTKSSPIGGLQP